MDDSPIACPGPPAPVRRSLTTSSRPAPISPWPGAPSSQPGADGPCTAPWPIGDLGTVGLMERSIGVIGPYWCEFTYPQVNGRMAVLGAHVTVK